VVAIVHDRGADGGQYRRFAESLADHGIATCAVDLRGCGRSAGSRFQPWPTAGYLRDTQTMMSLIGERAPGMPRFLLGHGIGALVACLHAMRHESELDGLICEAILLDAAWSGSILRMLGRLAPVLSRLASAALPRANEWMYPRLGELSLPRLLLHGSADAVAPPSHSESLYMRVNSADKTLQVFEGYHHDLINDRGHAIVRDKACQWIQAQLDSNAQRRRIGIEYINE
jgi:alpha-beta hydrolase superfamily lysophospholipase